VQVTVERIPPIAELEHDAVAAVGVGREGVDRRFDPGRVLGQVVAGRDHNAIGDGVERRAVAEPTLVAGESPANGLPSGEPSTASSTVLVSGVRVELDLVLFL
jgi:hypothetical protein